jgi:hypothetical protein
LLAALIVADATSCVSGVYDELYVENETTSTWMIRVPLGGPYEGLFFVTRVGPMTRGVATDLRNDDPTIKVELIDDDCRTIGVFETIAPDVFRVPGVDGLTLTRFPAYTHFSEQQVEGIEHLDGVCGGVLFT